MKQEFESYWMWFQEEDLEEEKAPEMCFFRKVIFLKQVPLKALIQISADSRYKLYINGKFVEVGPSKGDGQIWFYDELEVTSNLKKGKNVIGVMVLRYPQKPACGNQGVISTACPGLYFKGYCRDFAGEEYDFSADDTWKYYKAREYQIVPEAEGFAPLCIFEKYCAGQETIFWKEESFDDSFWKQARPYHRFQIRDAISPGNLEKRTIPFMYRKQRNFQGIVQVIASTTTEEAWNRLLLEEQDISVPPFTEEIVEIDAGEEMTGYLNLAVADGQGTEIEVLQSEAYVQETDRMSNLPIKTDRLDFINGHLEGYSDYYYVAGNGTEEHPEIYEPFWFRTFRFIRLRIRTQSRPMIIKKFDYEETGYPLKIESKVETSDDSLKDIWDISARTLRRCMHETYEDCPFYEQLQYAMDARSEILYTYASAADDRLARKCMDDFRRAQRYDGMISSAYPNKKPNVIPGFSIYYILMLHDHMMYFGDKNLIRYHMPAVENVLHFFHTHLTPEGYVGKVGGQHRKAKFWSFVDWTPQWSVGVPNATLKGSVTMESLLYIYGCQKAGELAEFIGRSELAAEYHDHAAGVQESIRKYCMDEEGLIQDGPAFEEYSQHCQVFGVLTKTLTPEEGRRNLLRSMKEKEHFAQCTVSMALYLFRALEETGLYEYSNDYWNIWRKMVENHMTTSAESESYCRSECHAWGALALYELPAVILGVKPASPGFETIEVKPNPGYLTWAKGEVITPKGIVRVSWEIKDGKMDLNYELPNENKMTER